MTQEQGKRILRLAQQILNDERIAVQNAELGNDKSVYKRQASADDAMRQLIEYVEGLCQN